MPVQRHEMKCIALTQLETALRLYFEHQDYYSVITLAGVADEIFGQLLKANNIDSSLETSIKTAMTINSQLNDTSVKPKDVAEIANFAKNRSKHWNPGQPLKISFDHIEEAQDMLNRAIDNYWLLEMRLSPAMDQFQHACMAIQKNNI